MATMSTWKVREHELFGSEFNKRVATLLLVIRRGEKLGVLVSMDAALLEEMLQCIQRQMV